MRRDKTFARIFLIFSIASVVLAAPAVVRQRRFVTDRAGEESTDELTLLLAPNSDPSESSGSSGSVTQGPPPAAAGSRHQDLAPASVVSQLNDPASVSGTSESHYVPPPTLGNPPSQDDVSSASELAQLHEVPLSGSGTQPLPDYTHPSWYGWRPVTEIEEVAEPDVPDVQVDDFHDHIYEDFNDHYEAYLYRTALKEKEKLKEYCFLCWDWH